jgi:hypothetical protein
LPDFYRQQLADHHYRPGPQLEYIAVVEINLDTGAPSNPANNLLFTPYSLLSERML